MRDFKVGDWLVQPRLCRMARNGSVVHVRPQIVELLCCLAERRGEVALRSELVEEVWPDRHVGESSLARCVAELRQVFEDDVRKPSFIETIPKRGYRLVAPVEFSGGEEPARSEAAAPAAAASGASSSLAPPERASARTVPYGRLVRPAFTAALILLVFVVTILLYFTLQQG